MYRIGTYEIYKEAMNLRDRPSTSGNILAEIPRYEKIEVVEISDRWGKTTYKEKTGWCSLSDVYARRIGPLTTGPYCDYEELYEAEKAKSAKYEEILSRIKDLLKEF